MPCVYNNNFLVKRHITMYFVKTSNYALFYMEEILKLKRMRIFFPRILIDVFVSRERRCTPNVDDIPETKTSETNTDQNPFTASVVKGSRAPIHAQ